MLYCQMARPKSIVPRIVNKKTMAVRANSSSDCPLSSRAHRLAVMIYCATRNVAARTRLTELGMPGKLPMTVVNVFVVVTVTVITRCPMGHATNSDELQSFGAAVGENVPLLV